VRFLTVLVLKKFKKAFITVLISYFKNNVVLLNNLIELSDKIIKNPITITIPLYYTKYLAKNENSIPKKYLDFLNGPKN
jgi:hypothetical protein